MRPLRSIAWICFALGLAPIGAPARAAQNASQKAGVAAAVRGEVVLARATVDPHHVVSGEDVLMRDTLRSSLRSGMQILLLDETVFTIGPQSEIVVDEFIYDPSTSAGKISATVAKGVFRFVTGKVAHKNPSDMNVALPAGIIGVRGTIVAGRVDAATKASLVVLLGDSRGSAGGSSSASIEVCNVGRCENVARPGFGVRIGGADSPPGAPFPVDEKELAAILEAVGDPEGTSETAASDDPGQLDGAGMPLQDGQRERDIRRKLQGLNALDTLSDRAAQDARNTPGPTPTIAPEPPPPPPSSDTRSPTGGSFSAGPGLTNPKGP
jgi:hypothetical protein